MVNQCIAVEYLPLDYRGIGRRIDSEGRVDGQQPASEQVPRGAFTGINVVHFDIDPQNSKCRTRRSGPPREVMRDVMLKRQQFSWATASWDRAATTTAWCRF